MFPVLEKVFGCVVVERRVPIMPQKRAGHPVATLAVEIAGSKGRASAQGREAGGGTRRGKTLETGRETKEKRGGRGRLHNNFQFGRNQKIVYLCKK